MLFDLPYTQQTLTGSNLISETLADLSRGEGHSTVVKLEESTKVDKVALSSLGSKVSVTSARSY